MKGRPPKTIARRIREGDAAKVGMNKLNEMAAAEPQPLRGLPACPTHLQGLARKTWKFLATQIEAMDMDRKPDALMLEGICMNYARAVEADMVLTEKGLTIANKKTVGEGQCLEIVVLDEKPRPEVSISNNAWKAVRAFCSEFGLSPVSRTRIHLGAPVAMEDEFSRILNAPRETRPSAVQ